jgi:Uncharacterized protein conserved in bacteria (DUF2087)
MNTRAQPHPPYPERLAEAAAMVIKQHVGLGTVPERSRDLALALVWAGLPDGVMDEKGINGALRAVLEDGVGAFLATDHVELRRWLADAGWLQRDGWGRAYERVAFGAFEAERRAWVEPLLALDVNAWARGLRQQHAAERERRRARWERGQPQGAAA